MGSQPTTAKIQTCCSGPWSFQNNAVGSRRIPKGVTSTAKDPRPWEGVRGAKSEGKLGKETLGLYASRQTTQGIIKSTDLAPKVRLTKKPDVLAQKQAALFKVGKELAPPKNVGSKRKNDKGLVQLFVQLCLVECASTFKVYANVLLGLQIMQKMNASSQCEKVKIKATKIVSLIWNVDFYCKQHSTS